MQKLNVKHYDKTLLLLALVLPIVTTSLSWILHQTQGNARTLLVFISETDHPGPEAWAFKIGFFATGIVDILLGWRMFNLLQQEDKKSKAILISSAITGFGLILVATFRWADYPAMHLIGAVPVFIFGTLWGISVHRLASKLGLDSRGGKIRRVSIPLTIIATVGLFVSFQVGVSNYPTQEDRMEMMELDIVSVEMLFAAGFEWLLFLGFMLSIYSFKWDIIPLPTSEPESSDHSV